MNEYLLFRLYGPLAAWGEPAVGEYRPSHSHPGKSAVMGLIAAALGIRREEEVRHAALAAGYGLAVLMRAPGLLLRDYHTAQVPSHERKAVRRTRRDEVAGSARTELNTILSTRDYRSDALWDVVLWVRADAPHSLAALAEALLEPRFTLYLGRKSCPPALPLEPQVIRATGIVAAAAEARFKSDEWLSPLTRVQVTQRLYWEDDGHPGVAPEESVIRRDLPASRQRWQFSNRIELAATLVGEG